jgi:hypothetical protein
MRPSGGKPFQKALLNYALRQTLRVHSEGSIRDSAAVSLGHKEVPVTHLRKMTLDEIARRNYTESATHAWLRLRTSRAISTVHPISSDRNRSASTPPSCSVTGSSRQHRKIRGSAGHRRTPRRVGRPQADRRRHCAHRVPYPGRQRRQGSRHRAEPLSARRTALPLSPSCPPTLQEPPSHYRRIR